ncbi:type II secretion system F family protein [uncultured Eubacterium sp.]|jgi:tight adherence protein B|uniref:type II secretion system F family protein n=1 Tax=uncultured Eubacterium sp. TaxID=165185 RepID=UPI000EE36214|nr:type II secretion system F family protein [uncultured Eubacterium sp.]HAH19183.1 secretion system protein [Eubacterium sp.]
MIGLQISFMNMDIAIGLFTLGMMALAGVVGFIVYAKMSEDQRYTDGRVDKIGVLNIVELKDDDDVLTQDKKKRKKQQSDKSLTVRIENWLFEELLAADIMMKPEEYLTIWIVIFFVPAGIVFLFTQHLTLTLVFLIAGGVGPYIFIKHKQNKRRKIFESQLCDALMISTSCLRSGLTFQQAMETIAKDMDAPISTEFARACSEINFGSSMDKALSDMVARIKSPDLMLAVSAVSVQRQTGGNLSQILETISNTIRERIKVKADVSAVTSQGRMSGLLIGVLPIGLGLVLNIINPDYMKPMLETGTGHILLGICVFLEVIGFLVIKKIVDIKY